MTMILLTLLLAIFQSPQAVPKSEETKKLEDFLGNGPRIELPVKGGKQVQRPPENKPRVRGDSQNPEAIHSSPSPALEPPTI